MRPGFVRVAGVTTVQIHEELVWLKHDRALRSLSQALGIALAEWSVWRGKGALHPGAPPSADPTAVEANGVLNPSTEGGR